MGATTICDWLADLEGEIIDAMLNDDQDLRSCPDYDSTDDVNGEVTP